MNNFCEVTAYATRSATLKYSAHLHATRAWMMHRMCTSHCAPCTPLASPSVTRSATRRPPLAMRLPK